MSAANVELAKRGYAAVNAAYAEGSVESLRPLADETWAQDGVFVTRGALFPEAGEWPGREGFLRFLAQQMEAFERMWIAPLDFIEAGDRLLVPIKLGGTARHTGIDMEFELFHVFEFRDGQVVRLEPFLDRNDALQAVGLA
jgi:ketosteroid isomerase-like protein